jgi:hypothetical protein
MIDNDDKIPFWRRIGEKAHEHDCRLAVYLGFRAARQFRLQHGQKPVHNADMSYARGHEIPGGLKIQPRETSLTPKAARHPKVPMAWSEARCPMMCTQSENPAKRRCMESEIAQKQNKFECEAPEMTCGVAEDTCKCPRTRNEPFHCPCGSVVTTKRDELVLWGMENLE